MKNKLLNTLTAVILLLMPNVNFGQAPTLGTTADFALFTTVGLNKNSSIYMYNTHVTGNVGSNSGAVTGYGNVDGTMCYTSDPKSMQAETDLLIANGQLDAATPTMFPPGTTLGSGPGQILFSGIYSMTSAALTLDQNLILDAQGDSSKVFIFQLHGTFSSNANSKVKLINGALACNVFWKVDGAVGLATNTSMKGTIVATAAISLTANDTLEGRALAINGDINVADVLVYTPIGCGSVVLTGPTKPNLASANCYAIFSSNGALTNTAATSTSIGDVGNNGGGAITGWAAGDVTGTLHLVGDPSTIACATDLSNAYNTINALPIDIELLAPTELGHSLVLTPHVYHMGGSAFLTDTLILNAEGNPNAVFVIKITGGNLTTTTYANIKLINGALSQNVFWVISGGYVEISDYSVFRGNIIVPVGAINLRYTGIQLDGRALTMNGMITTEGLAAVMPPGCGSSPIVISGPNNQTVCLGDTASFTVTASGSGLTYQWMKGTTPLVNGGNISGVDSATLYIYPAAVSDTSSFYNVIVSGYLMPNDTSTNASLTVNTPAVITTQPTNQIVCAGGSVNFSVVATGTGLTYQWRKGTTNLINSGNISGAGSSVLTINPAGISDTSSNYNVIVMGTCANDTSLNVSLMINTAPVITMQPSSQTICAGSSVSFSVAATGSGLVYQWRKGTTNLINSGNISGADSSILTINPSAVSDTSSNYNVIVMGTCANDTSMNVSLIINTAPVITIQPISKTICAGSSVSFSVAATGTGLMYQWRKGTVNLINGATVSGADSIVLTINPAAIADTSSNYNVVITGTCANDTSVNVMLTVNTVPVALANTNSPVCAGSSLSLTAQTAAGANYSWTGPNGYASASQDSTILSAAVANSGTYTLIVSKNGCSDTTTTIAAVNLCFTDLSVVKTVSNMSPFIGTTVIFTIEATNDGPDNGTGVEVNDILQSGYTFVSSTVTAGVFDPSTGVWTLGNMVNGASATLTITATVNSQGNYVNTAIIYGIEVDANMVNNTSSVEPVPTDFNIPEGFSPNGDGINDLFVIRGILNFPKNTFVIYNRWGNKMFEASPYQNKWDGTATSGLRIGGNELPVGTYFYILDLKDGSDVFKGTIYLNR